MKHQIRVFISSAFRDLWDDRDVLVHKVFPEIRHRCYKRGVDFIDVDLRWGVPKEAVRCGKSLSICLQQIDLCRPYFIGLLGEHYGSPIQPELRDLVCAEYPWIKKGNHVDCSLTELEILYALFDVGQNVSKKKVQATAEKALFYFRDSSHVCEKQQNLKQRIHDTACQTTNYSQATDLEKLVLEQLWKKIEPELPAISPQQEHFEHETFALDKQKFYVKHALHDFERLNQHVVSDDPPLVIIGESGCGKSALLANWAKEYKQAHPDEFVFCHFCGSSPASTDPIALLRRIMSALGSHFRLRRKKELPTTTKAVIKQFPLWLAKVQGRAIVIIDGFNQLEESIVTEGWLPNSIPSNIRLFLSTLPDKSPLDLGFKGVPWHLGLLTKKNDREKFTTDYFNNYGKKLSQAQTHRLLNAPETANPLYLWVILEELRIFGNFSKLEEHLNYYLDASDIPVLYQKVLQRLEDDFNLKHPNLVENALCFLWVARRGLRESELLSLLETAKEKPSFFTKLLGKLPFTLPQTIWSPLSIAFLQNVLVNRDGFWNFSHSYIRDAVEERYLNTAEKKQAMHKKLADYFESAIQPLLLSIADEEAQQLFSRIADELPHQLDKAYEKKRLQACISNIPMFLQFSGDKEYELWWYWFRLRATDKIVSAYKSALADYEKTVSKENELELASVLKKLGSFFDTVGYVEDSQLLLQRAVSIYEKDCEVMKL